MTARQSREASKAKSTINNEEYESISQVAGHLRNGKNR